MKTRYILFSLLLLSFWACEPEIDEFEISSGSADFSNYVSLGNSLTAGYADGSLYRSGQEQSYPSMLAGQFAKAGGGEFVQPLMTGEVGILPGKLQMGYSTDCLGATSLGPVAVTDTPEAIAPVGYAVNNLGVPGAKSFHLLAEGYGSLAGIPLGLANPYYARFASSETASVIGDAMMMSPTFFTLWIGNNDVLGYATSGGIGDTITGQDMYAFFMNTILQTLTSGGAKGAIANIPDISAAPFFTTIPYNALVLTQQEQVDALNQAYAPLGITFNLGQNALIIADGNAPGGMRQMTSDELVLLTTPQDSIKCAGWGSQVPIASQYILTESEIANINSTIEGYNATISGLAATYDLALVDINSFFKVVQEGYTYRGESFSAEFVTGNAFSLDGIHLTPKGYAVVANEFIYAINSKFGASLPTVNPIDYPAVVLP